MKPLHLLLTALTIACCCTATAPARAAGHTTDDGNIPLKVATFNIRYDNPADGPNRWECRKDSLTAVVAQEGWDIVGMQEVLHHQLQDILQRLPRYGYVGVGREDGKTKGEYAPILYDTLRVKLLESQTFWLSQYPDSAGFIGWDGACTRIATWARFCDKRTRRRFLVINTHFDHVGQEAVRNSARMILKSILSLAQGDPVIVTGDFNMPDDSEPYRILTADRKVLKDLYKDSPETVGTTSTYHDFGRIPAPERAKIDFIFISPSIKVLRSGIIRECDGPSPHISDHNPHWGLILLP